MQQHREEENNMKKRILTAVAIPGSAAEAPPMFTTPMNTASNEAPMITPV